MKKVMKRVVKEPDIRRAEIILAAQELFEKDGYVNTSVEAIIKKVGIAKGTFYYYFRSKKEILRALVENTATDMEDLFNITIESGNLSALEKLNLIFRGPQKTAITKSSVMELIHKPENRELQEELNIKAVAIIAPHIAKLLEQGYKEGIFKKTVSVEIIQILLAGSQFVLDSGLFKWSAKQRVVFLKSIQTLLEELAGAKPGLLDFIADEK